MTAPRKPGRPMSHCERAQRTSRVRIDLYLSAEVAASLDAVVEARGSSRTAVVEDAVWRLTRRVLPRGRR